MLMTIQLPNNFMIAHPVKIQKIDLEPRRQRAAFSMNGIGMPVDVWSVSEPFVSQQMKLVPANVVCFVNDLFSLVG